MPLTTSGFVTILPRKEVELGADRLLHRADHARELQEEIEFACSAAHADEYATLPGGAVRAINPHGGMTLAKTDHTIAVFKGNLSNKAELLGGGGKAEDTKSEAELLLQLYDQQGLDMLGRLEGSYAWCLYDAKQARVLAARDHGGAVPLVEGRSAQGSLIIACGTFMPEGVSQVVEIKPGEYKYGWNALPRPFKQGSRIVAGRASADYSCRRRSVDAFAPPSLQRKSVDGSGGQQHHQQQQRGGGGGGGGGGGSWQHHNHHHNGQNHHHGGRGGGGARQRSGSHDGGSWRHDDAPHHAAPAAAAPAAAAQHHHDDHHHSTLNADAPEWMPGKPLAAPAAPAVAAVTAKAADLKLADGAAGDGSPSRRRQRHGGQNNNKHKAAEGNSDTGSGATKDSAPAGAAAATASKPVARTGSCGELAALARSPPHTAAAAAAPQGLAC